MNFIVYPLKDTNSQQLYAIGETMNFLKKDYPRFYDWFTSKVIPGIKTSERQIYIASPSDNPGCIAGVMILKDTAQEKKICSLYVAEEYRSNKLGTKFLSLATEVLKTEKPVITVSSTRIDAFSGLFKKFGYLLYECYPKYYSTDTNELSYNGPIEPYLSKQVANA